MGMTFYGKELVTPRLKHKTAQFDLLPYSHGKSVKRGALSPEKCVNFRLHAGALRGGWGTKRVFQGNPLEGYDVYSTYVYEDGAGEQKMVMLTAQGVYAFPLQVAAEENVPIVTLVQNQNFLRPLNGFTYITSAGNRLLMLCADTGLYQYNGTGISRLSSAPSCTTGCAYYDRIFVASAEVNYRVYFCSPLDESHWAATQRKNGYVDLSPEHGAIHALFPCGKGLYALRDNGFTLIRAEEENYNFKATPVPAAFGKVYDASIATVGEKLVFLTSDGLYAFDGNNVKRLAENLLDGIAISAITDCLACAFGTQYVLSFKTAAGEKTTLFLDVHTQEGWFSDIEFSAPACFDGRCYFSDGGVLCEFTNESVRNGEALTKVWESGYTYLSFGAGLKILKRLTITGKGNFKISIRIDDFSTKKEYLLDVDGEKSLCLALKGKGFSLRIENGDKDCVLEKITATVATLREG